MDARRQEAVAEPVPRRADATDRFRELVAPEIEVLLRASRTLTGSSADAEDAVQETLLRAFRALEGFDGAHPRAWLLTILRRVWLNMQRRQRPTLLGDRPPGDGDPGEPPAGARPAFGATTAASPEQVVLDRVLGERVEDAVGSLDVRFRTVLLLVDVDQLSYAEVAGLLDVPVGTVMSRLSRARERVRRRLDPTGAGPERSAANGYGR